MNELRAPFPWWGGKRRVAHLVWERFGDVANYVEPFFGSGAVLLGRPHPPRLETVNDKDAFVSNFWRAVQHDPEAVAHYADGPVHEADLHARHRWLVTQTDFRERLLTDPDFYDPKIAGWWVWGLCAWIGSGWCASGATPAKRPHLGSAGGMGIHAPRWAQHPDLGKRGDGRGVHRKMPHMNGGRGEHRALGGPIPDLVGDSGAAGRGVHTSARGSLMDWFERLAARLRRVRVCCGEWDRILGPTPTWHIGTTAVFLDPPYAVEDRADLYTEESRTIAHRVREWAIAHGDHPRLRIALCGYEGEHEMPASWSVVAWKSAGGYGNQRRDGSNANAHRERIWFSPACLPARQTGLFDTLEVA